MLCRFYDVVTSYACSIWMLCGWKKWLDYLNFNMGIRVITNKWHLWVRCRLLIKCLFVLWNWIWRSSKKFFFPKVAKSLALNLGWLGWAWVWHWTQLCWVLIFRSPLVCTGQVLIESLTYFVSLVSYKLESL